MKKRTFLAGLASGLALQPARALEVTEERPPVLNGKIYTGPEITQLLLHKDRRMLYLLHKQDVMKSYHVRLGFNPSGHKLEQGDGRTPEGLYHIDRRNYNSAFYLSLGISYPNSRDIARSRAAGVLPGGDIFIHGGPRSPKEGRKRDWTAGCISLRNDDMREVFWMARLGTPIFITV